MAIIIGILTVIVSLGMFRGNNAARVIVAIIFALNLISAIVTMFAFPAQLWSAFVGGALALIGLLLLFSQRANEFFRAA